MTIENTDIKDNNQSAIKSLLAQRCLINCKYPLTHLMTQQISWWPLTVAEHMSQAYTLKAIELRNH